MHVKRIISLFLLIGSLYSAHIQASALSAVCNSARSVVKSMQENPRSWLLGASACTVALFAGYKGYRYHRTQEAKKAADIKQRVDRAMRLNAVEDVQSPAYVKELIQKDDYWNTGTLIDRLREACSQRDIVDGVLAFSQVKLQATLEGILYDAAAYGSCNVVQRVLRTLSEMPAAKEVCAQKALRVANMHGRKSVVELLLGTSIDRKDISLEIFIDEAAACGMNHMVDYWMNKLFENGFYVRIACKLNLKERIFKWLGPLGDVWRIGDVCSAAIKYKQYDLLRHVVESIREKTNSLEKEKIYLHLLGKVASSKDYKAVQLLLAEKERWLPGSSMKGYVGGPDFKEIQLMEFQAVVEHEQWKAVINVIDGQAADAEEKDSVETKKHIEEQKKLRSDFLRKQYKEKPSDELFAIIYYCAGAGFMKRKAYCDRRILIDLTRASAATYEDCVRFLEKVFKARLMIEQLTEKELEEDFVIYKILIGNCCESDCLRLVHYLIKQGCDCNILFSHFVSNADKKFSKEIIAELLKNNRRIKNCLEVANQDQSNCFSRVNPKSLLNLMADYCFHTPEHRNPVREMLVMANQSNNHCLGDPHRDDRVERVFDLIADYCPQTLPSNLSEDTQKEIRQKFELFVTGNESDFSFRMRHELEDYLSDGGSIYSLYLATEKCHFKALEFLEEFFNDRWVFLQKVHREEGYLTSQMLEKIDAIRQAKKTEKEAFETQALDEKQKKEQYQQSKALFQAIKDGNADAIVDNITKYTVNLQDEDGNTPLHVAAVRFNDHAVGLLRHRGGQALDVCLENKFGHTALIATFNEYNTQADEETKEVQADVIRAIISHIINVRLRSKELDPAIVVKYQEQKAQARKLMEEKNDPVLNNALREVL